MADGSAALGSLTFGATGYTTLSGLSWNPGDTLDVNAAGATGGVDAFSGSVVVRAAVTNVSPALSLTSPYTLIRANGFTLTWTAGSAESVEISITGNIATGTG